MTLPEISLCLAFATVVATSTLSLITDSWNQAVQLKRIEKQSTDLAILRSLLARIVEQADAVRVFSSVESARSFSSNPSLSGMCVGMRFASDSSDKLMTLEFRPEEARIWLRSSEINEWVVLSNVQSCLFSVNQGVLRMEFSQRGKDWEIWSAIN